MSEIFSFLSSLSLWGSIVNCLAVIVGATAGLIVKKIMGKGAEGGTMSRVSDALMNGVSLCVLLIGVSGAIKTQNMIIVIVSMVIGTAIGELCDLDKRVTALGKAIESKTGGRFGDITQGFVSASLLFCVGAMTIVGSLNSGVSGDHSMLYTKSLLDLISAFAFASALGFGVLFSAGFVLVFQGSITLLAVWIAPLLSDAAVLEMTAVGSLLIVGLALNMLGITKLKIMNHMPAVFLPMIFFLFI